MTKNCTQMEARSLPVSSVLVQPLPCSRSRGPGDEPGHGEATRGCSRQPGAGAGAGVHGGRPGGYRAQLSGPGPGLTAHSASCTETGTRRRDGGSPNSLVLRSFTGVDTGRGWVLGVILAPGGGWWLGSRVVIERAPLGAMVVETQLTVWLEGTQPRWGDPAPAAPNKNRTPRQMEPRPSLSPTAGVSASRPPAPSSPSNSTPSGRLPFVSAGPDPLALRQWQRGEPGTRHGAGSSLGSAGNQHIRGAGAVRNRPPSSSPLPPALALPFPSPPPLCLGLGPGPGATRQDSPTARWRHALHALLVVLSASQIPPRGYA